MKRFLCIFCVTCVSIFFSGCDQVRESLHMIPNQDEQACLNSERLKFKDPDVLFVANLGNRGLPLKENQYWVRYKAKNSYGAFLQGNMLCEKNSQGKWVRAESDESTVLMDVQISMLRDAEKALLWNDHDFSEKLAGRTPADYVALQAQEVVLQSPNDLSKYKPD